MAINLTTKYSSVLEKCFTHDSYFKSHAQAKVDLVGAKSCRVYMLNTVPVTDYNRSGSSRYGEAKDIQDIVMEYTMTQDKSFTGFVDKGDESEQAIAGKAGAWLRQQIREQVTPTADKYAFSRLTKLGHSESVSAEPSKSNIIGYIYNAATYMDEHMVPENSRVLFIRAKDYKNIILSDEWHGLDALAGKQLPTGTVGEVAGFSVVKVPTHYFPEGCYFIAMQQSAVAMPYKINDTKMHIDPPGYSGHLIEGRQTYDVFVLGSKADAVYSCVADGTKLSASISMSGAAATVTCSGATEIRYTVDGSDPRFAMTYDEATGAGYRVYTAAVTLKKGETIRAVGTAAGKFPSDVVDKLYT